MRTHRIMLTQICAERLRIYMLAGVLLLLGVLGPASARTLVTELQNGVDFYVGNEDAEAYDDPAYAPATWLLGVGDRTGLAYPHYGLIRFRQVSQTLNITNIVKAELRLYLEAEESRVPAFISTFRVLQDWDEGYMEQSLDGWYTYRQLRAWNGPGLTVANNIAAEDSFADRAYIPMPQTVVADGIGQWYAWDITDAARQWYDGTWREYGVVLTGANVANSFKQFASSEHPDVTLRPKLVITHNPEELIGDIFAYEENRSIPQTVFRPGLRVSVIAQTANGLGGFAATAQVVGPGYDTGLAVMNEGVEPGRYEYVWSTGGLITGAYTFTFTFVNPETLQTDTVGDFVLQVDADPPAIPVLQINQGATATSSPEVTLSMGVNDATEMRLTGDLLVPDSGWIPVFPTLITQLSAGDGLKHIEIEFRDAAGNVSEPVEASITLDATPIAVIGIQSWDAADRRDADNIYQSGQRIVIQVGLEDEFDLTQATLQITGATFDSGPMPIQPNADGEIIYEWDTTLLVDGNYSVRTLLQDGFGRVTEYPPVNGVPFEIQLDNLAPAAPEVIVLDGGLQTHSRTIDLGLAAQGATSMFLSGDVLDDANTLEWVPYATQARVHLVGEDGAKSIVAIYRDAAGNETAPVETNIRLEVQSPSPLDYGTLVLNSDQSGTLTLFFDEPLSQIQPDSFLVTLHNQAKDQETLLFTSANTQTGVDSERLWLQLSAENPLQTWALSAGGNLLLWADVAANSVLDASGNGNQVQASDLRIQIQIVNPGQLGSATATPSIISPNADGVQDSVLLQYTPLQNGTVRLRVEDGSGSLFHQQLLPNQRQGVEYQLEWTGSGEEGTPVPDGSYTLSLVLVDTITALEMPLIEAFAVTVDTQAPTIQDVVPVAGAEIPVRPTLSAAVFDVGSGLKDIYLMMDQGTQQWTLASVSGRATLSADAGPSLSGGSHTVHFHAEDQAGNHTVQSVSYTVVTGEAPILRFLNFPNPFAAGTKTQLLVSLNQSIEGGSVRIYNGAGDLVHYVDMKDVGLTPNEYRVPWDGRSLYGNVLSRGVYFAELRVDSGSSDVKRADRVQRHKVAIW